MGRHDDGTDGCRRGYGKHGFRTLCLSPTTTTHLSSAPIPLHCNFGAPYRPLPGSLRRPLPQFPYLSHISHACPLSIWHSRFGRMSSFRKETHLVGTSMPFVCTSMYLRACCSHVQQHPNRPISGHLCMNQGAISVVVDVPPGGDSPLQSQLAEGNGRMACRYTVSDLWYTSPWVSPIGKLGVAESPRTKKKREQLWYLSRASERAGGGRRRGKAHRHMRASRVSSSLMDGRRICRVLIISMI
ncbi:uncharacterized protein LY79DRAFT_66246 [Colletotrichum navitas]|uniref:Uncharacterized protein n=1 Tax=Colletotrichum navitas TaxID=681940 RepID=A0AAD8PL72_9PEZI|nr:uncharacterized protein LY79DRAFT_66246 [Colletotrichum navitas]KAK1569833.1 hypothetical protein LY79DRAFT_66246 [Colletotrichum navitas]